MAFKVTARTILHLGAELISSDAIAFYELIKNAFDAHSEYVEISVVNRIDYKDYITIKSKDIPELIGINITNTNKTVNDIKKIIIEKLDLAAPDIEGYRDRLNNASSIDEVLKILDEANYIMFEDVGDGMSCDDLEDIYLTIGTRSRQKERVLQINKYKNKEESVLNSITPVLGEKGVGRLSVMRLGQRLLVKTKKIGESRWNYLKIDWSRFSHDSDELLSEIDIKPYSGRRKIDTRVKGSTIKVYALNSPWSIDKLKEIANQEFSKLTDPFIDKTIYPIRIKYNATKVPILKFDEIIFAWAHATVKANFTIDNNEPCLSGTINYRLKDKSRSFVLSIVDICSFCNISSIDILKSLGPFSMELYWFNRRLLTKIDGIGDREYVRGLVAQWAGGLMVFRDGFRVNPYGSPNNDWLDLDREAFRSQGYKVNRTQIVGKVNISTIKNPALMDQTNREGLRNCDEKDVLVALLQHILHEEFKKFLNYVDEETNKREPLSFRDLESRVELQEDEINKNLNILEANYVPESEKQVITRIKVAVDDIRTTLVRAKELAETYQEGKAKFIHLAGVGLMVEIVAHELNRVTSNTLKLLDNSAKHKSSDFTVVFKTLGAQLKTLQKRLRILDPMSTRGRQVKESFDVVDWVKYIISTHEDQFNRHGIECRVHVEPDNDSTMHINAVKGMIVQILENIISNSVYWFKQQKKYSKYSKQSFSVNINVNTRTISFHDNGPGIPPDRKTLIFEPFYTTKPSNQGKGLGLFISKEIAEYNGAAFYLSDQLDDDNQLREFILKFPN